MLDTSALLAALVAQHALHERAREHLPAPAEARIPGIVLAETFARLRGSPFRVSATDAQDIVRPWAEPERILTTPAELYRRALDDAPGHNLGGQVHDYVTILTCRHHGHGLVTADRRQAHLATSVMDGTPSTVTFIG